MDGSFRLTTAAMEGGEGRGNTTVVLDHSCDPDLQRSGGPTDFVTLVSPEGIKAMMRQGFKYAKRLHEEGKLAALQPIARGRFGHEEMLHHPRAASTEGMGSVLGIGSQTGVGLLYSGGRGQAAAAASAAGVDGEGGGSEELRARL